MTDSPENSWLTESPFKSNATPIVPFNGTWPGSLALVCCSCSLFGSLMIVLTYLAFKDVRSTSRQILAFLSLANIGTSSAIIWGVAAHYQSSDSAGCQSQAVILIATGIAEFLWNIALALYLYVIITHEGTKWGFNGCPPALYFLCWLPGIVVALVTYLKNRTGVDKRALNTAEWCIIRGPDSTDMSLTEDYVVWSMIVGDGWNIVAIFTTFCLYILTKWHIHKETHYQTSTLLTRGALNAANQIDRKLTFIPLTYFLLHIWSFIRTVIALSKSDINDDVNSVWYKILLALQTIGDCSDGVANAIIFLLFSPKVRVRLKSSILSRLYYCMYTCKTCRCCRDSDDNEALNAAADGRYAQGSSGTSNDHAMSPNLSRYHWSRGMSPPITSFAATVDQEHTPLLAKNAR